MSINFPRFERLFETPGVLAKASTPASKGKPSLTLTGRDMEGRRVYTNTMTNERTVTPIADILRSNVYTWDGFDLSIPEDIQRMINVKMNDDQFWDLVESMETHGMISPVMFDGSDFGNGHHRLVAAILLGWDTILTTTGSEWSEFWP